MYNACIVLTDEHIHVGYYALAACVSYDIPTKNQSVSVLPIIYTTITYLILRFSLLIFHESIYT